MQRELWRFLFDVGLIFNECLIFNDKLVGKYTVRPMDPMGIYIYQLQITKVNAVNMFFDLWVDGFNKHFPWRYQMYICFLPPPPRSLKQQTPPEKLPFHPIGKACHIFQSYHFSELRAVKLRGRGTHTCSLSQTL